MHKITIRFATISDNELLAELGARAFYDTFATSNSAEDMAAFLAATYGAQKQAAELADPATLFLIAESDGVAVGYAMLQADASEVGISAAKPVELRRFYTLQEWIGRGIGAALMQASI